MIRKEKLKNEVIALRKSGLSYSEILKQVPVAKSTVSLWLRDVGLSKQQKQRLTDKKLAAIARGGAAKRQQRILLTEKIHTEAEKELGKLSQREFWLLGIALYWAEGSKEKEGAPGTGVSFSNSDGRMIHLFVKWLTENRGIERQHIRFEIYIHENNKHRLEQVRRYWAEMTGFPVEKFVAVYFKKNKIKSNRKNVGALYYGVLRVKVNASSSLNRRINGWVKAIYKNL